MKNAFHLLQPWVGEILLSIKKDIKVDYLPGSPKLYRTHFGNRPLNRVTFEEIQQAFIKELLEGNEEMAEWVVNRWVFQHGELYNCFAERLVQIDPDFGALKELSEEQSRRVLEGLSERFGDRAIYIFSVLNQVVFPERVFERLRAAAERQTEELSAALQNTAEEREIAKLVERHQRELSRMSEKCEQKLSGVLKKYTTDVNALKGQIRALQHQLLGKT